MDVFVACNAIPCADYDHLLIDHVAQGCNACSSMLLVTMLMADASGS
jgi:hypothetical protein